MEKIISILFVDDDPLLLQGLQRIMHPMRAEWSASFATSGEEALDLMSRGPFDVVISDMVMPGISGADLLNEVQRQYPDTIRIILSGHAEQSLVTRCLRSAHQFIAKPCDPEGLKRLISRAGRMSGRRFNESVRHAAAHMDTLPAMPALYSSISAALKSEDSGVVEVAMLIARDVGMTANILKLVNSAFFGLPKPIASVEGAVSYLGLDTIKNLVLSIELFDQYQRRPAGSLNIAALWEHSLATASAARRFARLQKLPHQQAEEIFSAGILHDAGKLALATQAPALYDRVTADYRSRGHPPWQVEAALFGADHAEVAGYLFGLWGLPQSVVEAITFHHRPAAAPAACQPLCACIHAADATDHYRRGSFPCILDEAFLRERGFPDTAAGLSRQLDEANRGH